MDDDNENPSRWRRMAVPLGVAAAVMLIGAVLYTLVNGSSGPHRKPVPEVVQLRIIQPPPPPPPPPPPKMEPPKMKQEVFKPLDAAPKPQEPGPPALDAKGEGPGDAFGLAGHEGGGDYLGGIGDGGGGSPFGRYAALVQQRAQDAVEQQKKLRHTHYRVMVKLWFAADGRPERAELVRSTGNEEVDRLLTEALNDMAKLPEPPPKDMPQPVVLRVSTT